MKSCQSEHRVHRGLLRLTDLAILIAFLDLGYCENFSQERLLAGIFRLLRVIQPFVKGCHRYIFQFLDVES